MSRTMSSVKARSFTPSTARTFLIVVSVLALSSTAFAANDRETKVRKDKADVEADDYWIYNDLPRGVAEAKKSGKPLLVVFRCIPCDACAKFDEQVVRRDPVVRGLMDRYVPVRIVHANGMDLSQFQFDFDQSFAAFLLNADLTIYLHREPVGPWVQLRATHRAGPAGLGLVDAELTDPRGPIGRALEAQVLDLR